MLHAVAWISIGVAAFKHKTAPHLRTALVWGVFIWPTPYRYEKVSRPARVRPHDHEWKWVTVQEVYRINRFTGTAKLVVESDY